MKTLLGWLIWVCVGFAAISAVTAYFTSTDIDPALYQSDTPGKVGENGYLLLVSPAGPDVPRNGATEPMYPAGTELTPEVLGQMAEPQATGEPLVKRVHISEFSWDRWSHKWWFIASVVVLTLCGLGQRMVAKGDVIKKGATDPAESLDAAIADLTKLRDKLPGLTSDHDRLQWIIEGVGEMQQTHLASFAEAREVLISRHGMGKYAGIMDVFAGAERKINRSWSAAADGVLGEALDNIDLGVPMLEEARRRLG